MGSRTGRPTRAASPKRSPARKSPAKKSPAKRKSPKKKVVKKAAAHPTYKEMIAAAIAGLKQRGGSSRQAITKYIAGHYKVGDNFNVHLRMALRRGIASGMLVSSVNHSGTFRLSKAATTPAKPKKKKVTAKKPAAKKAKKPKKKVAPKKKKAAPKKAKKAKTSTKKKSAAKSKKPAKKTATKKKAPAKKAKKAPAKKAKK